MIPDHLSFSEEAPRFWFSRRCRLAFIGCIGFLIVTLQRTSIEVAIAAMVNFTVTAPPDATVGTYWARRVGMMEQRHLSNDDDLSQGVALANYYYDGNWTGGDGARGRMMNKKEMSNNAGGDLEGCSNASELSILNTTLFTVTPRGDVMWPEVERSAILDSFYWGDLFIRIPAGFLSQRYGGKRIFGFSILLSSVCTVVIPLTSRVNYFLIILLRFITGASAGATIPAMSYLLGRWSPPDERCLLQSIANTGSFVSGSIIAVPLTGLLCIYGFDGGWPSAFYISGGLGMLWCIVWMLLSNDSPNDDSRISVLEKDYINNSILFTDAHHLQPLPSSSSPHNNNTMTTRFRWETMLTSLPVFAIALNHLTHEWVVYAFVKVIPIYLTDVLHLDFKQNSIGTLILPGVCFWCVMIMSAGAADRLHGYDVIGLTKIRKIMQLVGAILTGAMVASVMLMDCHHHMAALSVVIIGLSCCGLQYSGALVSHLDLAPNHAAVTMGVISTLGASVYFVLPSFVRMILHSFIQSMKLKWSICLIVTASCHVFSALLFLLFGSSQSQENNNCRTFASRTGEFKQKTENNVVTTSSYANKDPNNYPSTAAAERVFPSGVIKGYFPTTMSEDVAATELDVFHEAIDVVDPDHLELDTISSGDRQENISNDSNLTTDEDEDDDDEDEVHSCISGSTESDHRFQLIDSRPNNRPNYNRRKHKSHLMNTRNNIGYVKTSTEDDISESIV